MLTQTKRVIEQLKRAGFKRSDFQVRTPMDYNLGGYGRTRIILWARKKEQFARMEAMAQEGLNVVLYHWVEEPARITYPHVTESYTEIGRVTHRYFKNHKLV